MNVFSQYFGRFLAARRTGGLFRRRTILESLSRDRRAARLSGELNHRLVGQARSDLAELLVQLGTSPQGLSDAQVDALREKHGPNEVEQERPVLWWRRLWLSYNNPFNLLLTLLAVVSYFTGDRPAAVVIGSMVILATLIRFFQEQRSSQAARALKEQVSNTATVKRHGERAEDVHELDDARLGAGSVEIPIRQLVPGDIVLLSAGDMIPADCRVMTATDLFVGQSAMTGESLPVEKFPAAGSESVAALDMDNLVFMGTNVISGAATAVVLATGNETYFGTLATRVTRVGREAEPTCPSPRSSALPSPQCVGHRPNHTLKRLGIV